MCDYMNGVVTSGSYFTYNGVRYGEGTEVLFKKEFYEKNNEFNAYTHRLYIERYKRVLASIKYENGKEVWALSKSNFWPMVSYRYADIDPYRDIEKIVTPVWYYTPKELVKLRLQNGTWFWHVWWQTLIYAVCLLISPLFQQWYLIWTIGLYAYLRICYIELARGGYNRGW